MEAVEPGKVEETNRQAATIFEKLVADHPENADYRIDLARCLRNQGLVVADAGHPERAETLYRQALTLLESQDVKTPVLEAQRTQAELLNNIGRLRRPGAEEAYRRSLGIFQGLADRQSADLKDLHNLAAVQNNLGDFLIAAKRLADAGPYLDRSIANYEKLVAATPRAIDVRSHFGSAWRRGPRCSTGSASPSRPGPRC